jgi:hypothetical protein
LDTNGENEQMCKENTGNMIKSKSQVSKSSVQKKKNTKSTEISGFLCVGGLNMHSRQIFPQFGK